MKFFYMLFKLLIVVIVSICKFNPYAIEKYTINLEDIFNQKIEDSLKLAITCNAMQCNIFIFVQPISIFNVLVGWLSFVEECKYSMRRIIITYQITDPFADILFNQISGWIRMAPLGGIACFYHEILCWFVDGHNCR